MEQYNITVQTIINFDDALKENVKKNNPNWPEISDHPHRILIIGGCGSTKTDSFLNVINHQPDTDNSYLYVEDPYEAKYQFLIKKRENVRPKHFHDSKAFIEYSNNIVDIYKNIEDYNPNKKRKILIAVDDMITDMPSNKELDIRVRKLNISLAFITQSFFALPNDIRLNSTQYFIMKIPNKRELQQSP